MLFIVSFRTFAFECFGVSVKILENDNGVYLSKFLSLSEMQLL